MSGTSATGWTLEISERYTLTVSKKGYKTLMQRVVADWHGLKEKLVVPQEGKRRKFVQNSPVAFLAKIEKLIAAKAVKKAPRRKTKAPTQSRVV